MISPKAATVENLLTQSARLLVPRYQRGYDWEVQEIGDFFEDLSACAGGAQALYLGTVIFDGVDTDREYRIVDGQQRITTVLILLLACRDHAKQLEDHNLAAITQNFLTFVDSASGESKGPRLIASESIRTVFEHAVSSSWDGTFPVKINNQQVKRQVNRIKPVYDYFLAKLSEFDKDALTRFLRALYDTRLTRIDIDQQEEAFNIFERTNARGVDLEVSDLIKNFLYQQNVNNLEGTWGEIIRHSGGNMLRMLKAFYTSQCGYTQKSILYKKLKAYSAMVGGAEPFVENLRAFSKFYRLVSRDGSVDSVQTYFHDVGFESLSKDQTKFELLQYSLQALRLFRITQTQPLLYAAMQSLLRLGKAEDPKAAKAYIGLAQMLESFHFVNNMVCARIGNEVEKLYAEFCVTYSKTSDFNVTTAELQTSLQNLEASESEFTSLFCEISYERSSKALSTVAYIFDRIGNVGLKPGERVQIYYPNTGVQRRAHNIEHFYPQKPAVADGKVSPASVNNIGNLMAISLTANSKLGNGMPAEKIVKLRGELAKRVQNSVQVKSFLQEYGDRAPEWDDALIAERARRLAKESYTKVWVV